jgi:arginyl-tRNA synthetase
MKNEIKNLIKEILAELEIETSLDFVVDFNEEIKNGHLYTNVAMVYAKSLSESPKDLAEKIKEQILKKQNKNIKEIQIAGPGFINFFLTDSVFTEELKKIIELADKYGENNLHENKKILVEHSSPNLFKPFHVGHVMNNAIGESIVRLAKFSNANVATISFPSDISLGVAKAVFIILEKIEKENISENLFTEKITIEMLGDAYVEGTKRYEDDENTHARIKEIADNLYANNPSKELEIFKVCKDFNIKYFEKIVAKLGSKFDGYIYESESGVRGKEIISENTPKVFTESEGAIVYIPDEEKKNINTAVFINSQGNPTYEAKDVGLLDIKFEKYNPDLSIFITDHQQTSHFEVVLDACSKIDETWKERVGKSVHRTHGRMSFKGQKMSSRLGGVPLAEDLLNVLLEAVNEKSKDLEKETKEKIAISALKFTILKAMAGKNIDFDPDTSLSFEGDSGPYIQYSGVRALSVLGKVSQDFDFSKIEKSVSDVSQVEALLVRFPDVVENSIKAWSPHYIATYLLQVSQAFNAWYAQNKIIDENNPDMYYNIFITKCVAQVIENGLYLLGIDLPEKM